MNLISRCIVRIGSLAAPVVLALSVAPNAAADPALSATYQGQSIRFTHLSSIGGSTAIGVQDPGFATLLHATGALLTWKPGERYILITTSAPTVVSFALGDRRFDIGPISQEATFAPFMQGDEAYLPLGDVLRSLDLGLRRSEGATVLQPQLATLDVRQEGSRTTVLAHAGATLHARIVRESSNAVTYAFDGVGTTLGGTRDIGTGGVQSISVSTAGTIREPIALLTVQLAPGAVPEAPQNTDGRDVMLAFDGAAPPGSQPPPEEAPQTGAIESSPTPEPAPPAAPANESPAYVTGVTLEPNDGGVAINVAVTGNATFEWHRLRAPDNRFWIDLQGAQLQGPPLDESAPSPLIALRVRQDDPATVRIALSLEGPKSIELTPSSTGLTITVGSEDVADAPRAGSGSLGGPSSLDSARDDNTALGMTGGAENAAVVTPAPLEDEAGWKFAPRNTYVPTNPRLIVIDPGHGGSDRGTIHGGVAEADLTLDMAKRLRAILLAQGWEVKLTHDTDVDVYAPDDSPRDELQARVDVANNAGARLFVSVHANAFINAGPYGTTLYVSKPTDMAFARIVESQLVQDGTKDDGIVKSHMYVTLHARMPAVLIETAFLSNPHDYALLTSAAWREKVAQEIAAGIAEYAQDYPVGGQAAQ